MLLVRAQREGQELKNSQTRKELAPVDLIEYTVSKVGSQLAALFEALPMQLKKKNL